MKYFSLFALCALLACSDYSEKSDQSGETSMDEASESSAPNPLEPANDNLAVPIDWDLRLDDADLALNVHADSDSSSGIYFVNMNPGWHITTGPAAIFSHPGLEGSGLFKAETAIHLFDPGERRESFGLFFGGQNLTEENISYDYFLIRQGGEFLVKRRSGEDTSTLIPWTKHEAIMSFNERSEASELNTMSVEVLADSVHFAVNEVRVGGLASNEVNTDGLLGLRVNHALNLHILDVSVK